MKIQEKHKHLKDIIAELDSCVVAFSGGLDSSLLLRVAKDVLGDRVLAVTALSPTYPEWEIEDARRVAEETGSRHRFVQSQELDLPGFRDNPPDRCYHCKKELFTKLREIADEEGFRHVIVGATVTDLSDYRPGHRAAEELGVRSPLLEANLTKDEVRELAKKLNVSVWAKPAVACLASRFPYGERITESKLQRVSSAEFLLRQLGVHQYRVRSHDDVARIEVDTDSISTVIENRLRIAEHFKKEGFKYVALDLEGYRTGSMNETLPPPSEKKSAPTKKSKLAEEMGFLFADERGQPPPADEEIGFSAGPALRSKVKLERLEDLDLSEVSGWTPVNPAKDQYVVYVDGCSKGNPGPASYAFIVFGGGPLEMLRGGKFLGNKTNNQAEYLGLQAALEACIEMGFDKVQVLSDSELMVKQMNGLYRVKNPDLFVIWSQVKLLARKLKSFSITHVLRDKNRAADRLADLALKLKIRGA